MARVAIMKLGLVYLLSVLMCTLMFISSAHAKKRCQALKQKLYDIQAQQRAGYSNKRGQSLRQREDKAREKWWQCENPSYGRDKRKKLSKSSKKKSQTKLVNTSQSRKKSYQAIKINDSPFANNSNIQVKTAYQGEKKHAWLRFYQRPSKCHKPKNLSTFAYCSENKQQQRLAFEQVYLSE